MNAPGSLDRLASAPANRRRAMLWVVALAVAVRLVVLIVGHPLVAPDTKTYSDLAARLLRLDFAGYSGFRTPGYPLLMLMLGQNADVLRAVQLAFGVATSAALFEISYSLTRRARWSAAAAVLYAIGPHVLVYESFILTESLCTLLLVLSVLVYVGIESRAESSPVWRYLLLGTLVGLGALTRPMQSILLPVFCVALISRPRRAGERRSLNVAAFTAPALALMLGWCAVNKAALGAFTLSTIGGVSMLDVTAGFIERADPSYADMVATIVPDRDALLKRTGSTAGAGLMAYHDLKAVTRLDDAALSRRLLRLSASAVLAAPGQWLRAVAAGWTKFWLCPGGVVREVTGSRAIWIVGGAPYVFLNLCFLTIFGLAIVNRGVRGVVAGTPGMVVMISVVMVASLAQAVAEGTAGTRYAIPFQPLFFVVIATVGARRLRRRRGAGFLASA